MTPTLLLLRACLAAVLVLRCAMSGAVPIEVPDPRTFAHLPAAQQEAVSDELHRRMRAATPQERTQFRTALRQSIERLTPQEREEVAELTRQRWRELTPAERERITLKRRAWTDEMSPEEREEALTQRRLLLDALTPNERDSLRQPLPAR